MMAREGQRSERAEETPDGSSPDLYDVLGVTPEVSQEEIACAYRRMARFSHPDVRPDDPGAPARFRVQTQAYEVLANPARRARYDRAILQIPELASRRRADAEVYPWSALTRGVRGSGQDSRAVFFDSGRPHGIQPPLWAGPVLWEQAAEPALRVRSSVLGQDDLAVLASLLAYLEARRWWAE